MCTAIFCDLTELQLNIPMDIMFKSTHHFHNKNILVEIVLNLFVGNVNKKLLKGIVIEVFKAKDIQNSNPKIFASREQNTVL